MAYEFSPESFTTFTSDILAASGERIIYGDTDSLHIIGTEPVNIDIDDYRLGAFKQV